MKDLEKLRKENNALPEKGPEVANSPITTNGADNGWSKEKLFEYTKELKNVFNLLATDDEKQGDRADTYPMGLLKRMSKAASKGLPFSEALPPADRTKISDRVGKDKDKLKDILRKLNDVYKSDDFHQYKIQMDMITHKERRAESEANRAINRIIENVDLEKTADTGKLTANEEGSKADYNTSVRRLNNKGGASELERVTAGGNKLSASIRNAANKYALLAERGLGEQVTKMLQSARGATKTPEEWADILNTPGVRFKNYVVPASIRNGIMSMSMFTKDNPNGTVLQLNPADRKNFLEALQTVKNKPVIETIYTNPRNKSVDVGDEASSAMAEKIKGRFDTMFATGNDEYVYADPSIRTFVDTMTLDNGTVFKTERERDKKEPKGTVVRNDDNYYNHLANIIKNGSDSQLDEYLNDKPLTASKVYEDLDKPRTVDYVLDGLRLDPVNNKVTYLDKVDYEQGRIPKDLQNYSIAYDSSSNKFDDTLTGETYDISDDVIQDIFKRATWPEDKVIHRGTFVNEFNPVYDEDQYIRNNFGEESADKARRLYKDIMDMQGTLSPDTAFDKGMFTPGVLKMLGNRFKRLRENNPSMPFIKDILTSGDIGDVLGKVHPKADRLKVILGNLLTRDYINKNQEPIDWKGFGSAVDSNINKLQQAIESNDFKDLGDGMDKAAAEEILGYLNEAKDFTLTHSDIANQAKGTDKHSVSELKSLAEANPEELAKAEEAVSNALETLAQHEQLARKENFGKSYYDTTIAEDKKALEEAKSKVAYLKNTKIDIAGKAAETGKSYQEVMNDYLHPDWEEDDIDSIIAKYDLTDALKKRYGDNILGNNSQKSDHIADLLDKFADVYPSLGLSGWRDSLANWTKPLTPTELYGPNSSYKLAKEAIPRLTPELWSAMVNNKELFSTDLADKRRNTTYKGMSKTQAGAAHIMEKVKDDLAKEIQNADYTGDKSGLSRKVEQAKDKLESTGNPYTKKDDIVEKTKDAVSLLKNIMEGIRSDVPGANDEE